MELKTKILLGAGALGALALAFSVYKTVKEVKEQERINKELEEERIADLKALEEATKELETVEEEKTQESIVENIIDHYQYIGRLKTVDDLAEEMVEDNFGNGTWIPTEPDYEEYESEENPLRYPPNSLEAMNQYKAYRLSEISHMNELRSLLYNLFEIPFVPKPEFDKDAIVLEHIKEERLEFFGPESRYVEEGSIAELFLYFANMLSLDLDRPFNDTLSYLLECADISPYTHSAVLLAILESLTTHSYTNPDKGTIGLFGLPGDSKAYGISFNEEYWRYCDIEVANFDYEEMEEDIYGNDEED